MANLAAALRATIGRLARKEIRAATGKMKQAVGHYRREIAQLKRRVAAQEREFARLKARERKQLGGPITHEESDRKIRFSARSVRAQRKRLGLSAAEYGKLVGVSPLTIYHWEQGKARPRRVQMAALVAVRGIGKREAVQKLSQSERTAKRSANSKSTARRRAR